MAEFGVERGLIVAKYRSKSMIIEAVQFDPYDAHRLELPMGVKGIAAAGADNWAYAGCIFSVTTIQGQDVHIAPGEWIATEPDGIHHYPIADSVFRAKYDPIENHRERSEGELRRRDKPEISGNDVADEIESEAAITVGLINAMIAIAKVVGRSSFAHPSIKAALGWFRCDADVLAVFGQSPPSGIEGQAEEVEMIGTDETLEGWPCRAGFSGMGN